MIPDFAKSFPYAAGILDFVHRVRNRHTFTAVMFHRVLAVEDPRWSTSDPDYTISASAFDRCLEFFEEHYNFVSLRQVLDARSGGPRLPPRALLLTFDDGWADNVDYALPLMRRRGIPGALFVVADAVGRRSAFFQEQLFAAWRGHRITVSSLAAAIRMHGLDISEPMDNGTSSIRRLIRAVESLDPPARERLLQGLSAQLADPHRHMISTTELRELETAGVTVGVHGKTHQPMTSVADLHAELAGAREQVSAMLRTPRAPESMSFPHGRYDRSIALRAQESGYEIAFTSVPCINESLPAPSWLIGRLGFAAAAMQDNRGAIAPHKLAMYLFFRPRQFLS